MKKAKFQIKGMDCQSCATLIENQLKESAGVIRAKVNFDSQKVVVAYDEKKTTEDKIRKIIESVGEYKIVDRDDKSLNKNMTKINLSTPTAIILAGVIIAGAIIVTNRNRQNNQGGSPDKQKANTTIQVSPASDQQPKIAQFEITKDNHIRGDFNAPITLVEFSDFECPFCERHYPTLNKILNDYQGKVRLVYKHFPLSSIHPNAQKAAEASECADEQGKFWEYHDKLFENQPTGYSLEKFKKFAKDLGLNPTKFNDCLDSGKYAQKVQTDYQEGVQKGVQGTPATFVNGQLVSGALPYEAFKQIIDQKLNQ